MSDDPATVEFLSNLNRKAPKAKYSGKIAAIDVLYSCDISDMHSSLQNLVKSINTQKNKAAKFAADSSKSDQFLPPSKMEPGTKYRGLEFLEDTVFIMITISEELNHGLGDKLVVSSQEKSVTAAVMNKPIHTESGIELDMLFSGKSIMNRIVLSPIYQGSLERILEKMEDDIVDIYFGKK